MWNDLSMADKAKYIKLAVQNGITNIDNIRDTYNEYAGGGLLTNEQLLERVHSLGHDAYIKNGQLFTMKGSPLVYNYERDRFEFKNSKGRAMWLGKDGSFYEYTKEPTDPFNNKKAMEWLLDYPSIYQSVLEDAAFVRNRENINLKMGIPFLQDSQHTIKKGKSTGVPISTNLVDSIKANVPNRSEQLGILGIASTETDLGKYDSYTIANPDDIKTESFFKRNKSVAPADLLNNHSYYISPVRGALNSWLIEKGDTLSKGFIHGSPNFYYDQLTIPNNKELLKKAEEDIKYQRRVGKLDPFIKRGEYNPEDNPWLHAIQNLQDRNYGMGSDYKNVVNKNSKSLEYLLDLPK